ncbi:hypothetical protein METBISCDRAFT_23065 [Metschnikowia bicuspidata]|uniref:Arrestin C-terminal-like domain-containing protein n=1 Tax=Metschnikowia bicuspidata TaxID=27322 RepID=A0A4P9ZD87_9ASCO|nr:hypothetical protein METBISCDRAFT_23065 [Metschnikowia bicuspidata]
MVKNKAANRATALFDVRLKNLDHEIIILKGNEQSAASKYIEGRIVLSVTESLSLKKISLRLMAHLRLQYVDNKKAQLGSRPTRMYKKIFEYVWDSNEFFKYLQEFGDPSAAGSHQAQVPSPGSKPHNTLAMSKSNSLKGSTSSLKNLGLSLRSLSSSSLNTATCNSSSTSLSSKNANILVSGNYEIPFSAILPGDMPESVEGLPGASVTYRLEALIDRGKFHNAMYTKKRVRVVRTMAEDSVELSETMAVDNTWPNKVEYSLSVPSKAIAIGSGTLVSITLVPLLKGLRMGPIKMTLMEMFGYTGYLPPPHLGERVVCKKDIPAPAEDDPRVQSDKWDFNFFLRIPLSLSKCTQDVEVVPHLKVRHKLRVVIGLINPDGHVSELRASLPVQLFISPFVSVTGHVDDDNNDTNPLENSGEPHAEEFLFFSDSHNMFATDLHDGESGEDSNGLRSNESVSSFIGLVAPPVYEQHVNDRLWSDISLIDSPMNSGTVTPRSLYSRPTGEALQFSMAPIDTVVLAENLRQLSVQRQLQESIEAVRSNSYRGTTESEGDSNYFFRPIFLHSPSLSFQQMNGLVSPRSASPMHSRRGSDFNIGSITNKIPSYSEALKAGVEDTLSPMYVPPLPGSHIDLTEVNRRFEKSVSKSPVGSPPHH